MFRNVTQSDTENKAALQCSLIAQVSSFIFCDKTLLLCTEVLHHQIHVTFSIAFRRYENEMNNEINLTYHRH